MVKHHVAPQPSWATQMAAVIWTGAPEAQDIIVTWGFVLGIWFTSICWTSYFLTFFLCFSVAFVTAPTLVAS